MTRRTRPLAAAGAALSALLIIAPLDAQNAEIKTARMSADEARMIDGQDTYMSLCATCHGTLGKGNGPVANALSAPMPDLTRLAKDNGGKFPSGDVLSLISGDDGSVTAHGPAEMPVWGPTFRKAQGDALASLRIHNLVEYIESIQK